MFISMSAYVWVYFRRPRLNYISIDFYRDVYSQRFKIILYVLEANMNYTCSFWEYIHNIWNFINFFVQKFYVLTKVYGPYGKKRNNTSKHQNSETISYSSFPEFFIIHGLCSVTGFNQCGRWKKTWFLVCSNHKLQAGFHTPSRIL